MKTAILLAHGSREPQARASFEALVERVAQALPDLVVRPAYFSLGEPDLVTQVEALVQAGATVVRILPFFLLDGVHTRRDIPALVASLRQRWPHLAIELDPCLQDDPALERLLVGRLKG
jgi:sirohydrochlorin cobaltochelatase